MPASGYLTGDLATTRRANGHLEVTAELRVTGQEHVFAIGDITAIAEAKTAKAAGKHAAVVATNIRTLIQAGGELETYQPDPLGISLPLGPKGGASYAPHVGVLDAETTSRLKGTDMHIGPYLELLGLNPAAHGVPNYPDPTYQEGHEPPATIAQP
jgi:hypothetical protein